ILSMTCNNGSNNNAMIRELENMVPSFSGSTSHTHCFLHIINLVAKLLIQQFDVKRKKPTACSMEGLAAQLTRI
ncbi:hypothetical protein BU17DRAFT_43344, partial [Hysterangium stoloniferum]